MADAAQDTVEREVHYASRGSTHFDVILALFAVVLVVSNIVAAKPIEFGLGHFSVGPVQLLPIITDGGAFLFPLAYVLGDVISEVYGFKAARRAIFTGFAMALLTVATFFVVQHAPGASFYTNQEAYENVLGPVPQIVAASLAGYLTGQFLNSYVLVWMKARTAEPHLIARLASSTGVGELADTFIFCAIASSAIGIQSMAQFLNYFIFGFVWKTSVEFVVMPITMIVIAWLKRREPSYWGLDTPADAGYSTTGGDR